MSERKILLIRTQMLAGNTGTPIGLLYVSSYLKKFGYSVIVRDLNFKQIEKEIWKEIKEGNITLAGISMLSYQRKEAYALIKKLKEANKGLKVVVGGMHATSLPELLVEKLPVDAAIVGEGEQTMKELADHWIGGKGKLKEIKGIATKQFGLHQPRELIEDLDSLPMPDYSEADFSKYYCTLAKNRPDLVVKGIRLCEAKFANIITSRGCRGRCKFCNAFIHWKHKVRFRSAENVLKEIEYLYSRGVRLFNFNDDSFGQDKGIAIDICKKLVERKLDIAFYAAMRPDVVDEELLQWMKKAGCFCIAYGVESGSDKILKNINKGTTKEQIRKAITLTKKAGIRAYALLMIGNQGETNETIQETVDLMNELEVDIFSYIDQVWVYPGTVYYEMMKRKGRLNDGFWFEAEDGLPTFYDGFSQRDLNRWQGMIARIPIRW